MDIYYCAGLFMNVSFRRFPVVENDRIVGAITRFDLLRAVRGSFLPEAL
jgi:CBS domain-containing protein